MPVAAPAPAPTAQAVLAAPPTSPPVAPEAVDITGVKEDHGHWHDNDDKTDDKKHYHEWIANIVVEVSILTFILTFANFLGVEICRQVFVLCSYLLGAY